MPDKMHRCVADVMKTGKTKSSAYAICTAAMKPKPQKPSRKSK